MTQATTQRPQPQAAQSGRPQAQQAAEKSDFEKLLDRDLARTIEYTPFLSSDKVKISPQIVIRYFCKPTRNGHICTEDQAVRFMMLCRARGLNPWEGDAHLVGYDTKYGPEFNMITAHQAFLKRAVAAENFDGMESGVVVKHNETDDLKDIEGDYVPDDCTLVGGWARVHLKGIKVPCYRRLPLSSFDKESPVWSAMRAGMIVKCAEADALRSSFPNNIGGMYLDGEFQLAERGKADQKPETKVPAVNSKYQTAKDISDGLQSVAIQEQSSPKKAAATATDTKPSDTSSPASPSWPDLEKLGISRFADDTGIAVQNAKGETLTPQGQWSGDWDKPTVSPNTPEQDAVALEMTRKALAASK